ncbi:uncharacterized protein PHACADRAFT_213061 [Phanerochaete carnosa HHB-10118-sp]|uniref:Uncharacterized protein n=1 Tax=Phanerochaete carnosa (strain HHB-10118-sp) TaxID=650164 RepID=K5WLL4_PHACS|nr:uncharacterized protein PHACADRAFT_213061 [Phanerochaete carnosa HHB-10118-sp]EKM51187.1 hypothetical protein PHACADRAFT_213061 [Phanerochaete carnosa HHB-10118-sp]
MTLPSSFFRIRNIVSVTSPLSLLASLYHSSTSFLDYIDARPSKRDVGSYDVTEFKSVHDQYASLRDSGDEKALRVFIDERKQYVEDMCEFSESLNQWQLNQKTAKRSMRLFNEESIKQKLLELGYTESDFPVFECADKPRWISWLSILTQPRELTPRTNEKLWREEIARRSRRGQRELELRDVYEIFLPKAPIDDGPFPTASDAILIPEICSLLGEDEARIGMTEEGLLTVLPALQEQARKFKAELAKAMWAHYAEQSKIEPPRRDPEVDVKKLECIPNNMEYGSKDVLDLATALFQCYFCVGFNREPLPDTAVYSITELAKHVHTEHNRESRLQAAGRKPGGAEGPKQARAARRHSLLRDIWENRVRVFNVISSGYVRADGLAYHVGNLILPRCQWLPQCFSCPESEVLDHDHDLDKDPSFIRLLGDVESFEKPPLSPDEQGLVEIWSDTFNGRNIACNVCDMYTITPKSLSLRRQRAKMEPDELVRHVKRRHARSAKVDDAQEALPKP